MNLLTDAILGVSEYFTENKLIVICFGIILYEIFAHQKLSGFLKYALCAMVAVIFPILAVILLVYQPGVYEYGFIWTLVPVMAVVAYAGVRFLWDMIPEMHNPGKGKWIIGILAIFGVIFLLGNQGRLQKVTMAEAEERSSYGQVAEHLSGDVMLWGPRELMQWVRGHNAEVKLLYGMDMWDAKAAAYDGDAYEPELSAAYEWMLELSEFTYQLEITTDVVLPIPENVAGNLEGAFEAAENAGVNVIALPTIVYQRIVQLIPTGYEIQEVAEYTLLQGKK